MREIEGGTIWKEVAEIGRAHPDEMAVIRTRASKLLREWERSRQPRDGYTKEQIAALEQAGLALVDELARDLPTISRDEIAITVLDLFDYDVRGATPLLWKLGNCAAVFGLQTEVRTSVYRFYNVIFVS